MGTIKHRFSSYLHGQNSTGSHKASSYLKALDWLEEMLKAEPQGFGDCLPIWDVSSIKRLTELYRFTQGEARNPNTPWDRSEIPSSYLKKGFCSAALRAFHQFQIEYRIELNALERLHLSKEPSAMTKSSGDVEVLPENLSLLELSEGRESRAEVNIRLDQNAFRNSILNNYNLACCITGLKIPSVNRASHIIGWAEREDIRLDPRNGLCLSATYDAAFDRHLITLDDDYRLVLSKALKDEYDDEAFQEIFLKREGQRIGLPSVYMPKLEYLEHHRGRGQF